MKRTLFEQLVAEVLDDLPQKYRALLDNIVVVVEDVPLADRVAAESAGAEEDDDLLMGEFIGVPRTGRALWDMPPEPARVVLYQKNIEAYAADCVEEDPAGPNVEEIIREEVRLTVLHELGHFFGLEEDQLDDV